MLDKKFARYAKRGLVTQVESGITIGSQWAETLVLPTNSASILPRYHVSPNSHGMAYSQDSSHTHNITALHGLERLVYDKIIFVTTCISSQL